MPERAILTETWDDDWFQGLGKDQKLLFIYLWSNGHVNQAGLYHITLATINFDTKIENEALPDLINSLAPKIKWYPDHNLIWAKNFIKRQSKSPKFLAAAAKSLTTIHHNGAIKELMQYNLERYSISIPYQQYMDRLRILPVSASVSVSDNVSLSFVSFLSLLGAVPGWEVTDDDEGWFKQFAVEFPGVTLDDLKACVDYHSGRSSPKHKGIWKNRFRNWMIKKREFEAARQDGGQRGARRVGATRTPEDFQREW